MPTLDGSRTVSLASCGTAKCLTVYVAPWCGYCRSATPLLREMRGALEKKGVESRIVVGLDEESSVRAYAKEFGGGALLDLDRAIDPGGVPHFYISDKQGNIVRHIAGLPPDPKQLVGWILE